MQYLLVKKSDTLSSLSKIVGQRNIDSLITENGLQRTPNIGQAYYNKCSELLSQNPPEVTASRKSALLNNLTGSEEIFEKACLMDEEDWKIFSAFQSFPDAMRVPESITLPYSSKVIGDSIGNDVIIGSGVKSSAGRSEPVSSGKYKAVMDNLKVSDIIDPSIFNAVNTSAPITLDNKSSTQVQAIVPQYAYNLPWGKIQLYSSLLDETMDIPAYPEEGVNTQRTANFTNMPDIIYQFEPWITYESSGPREQAVSFHLHRDMWSGNHLDGRAKELVRFCEANTFPRYNGSTVSAPTVRLYINGDCFICGVLKQTEVNWKHPIGLDGWYLEFDLGLTIQEVSPVALNIDKVRNLGLVGSY